MAEAPGGDGVAVHVRDLAHIYRTADGPLTVLDGLSLDIAAGEIVAITGPSGVGKTTLLSLVGGLELVQSGTIEVDGLSLAQLSGDALAAYRRTTVGFVFQDYGLLPTLDARENVELALTFAGLRAGARRRRVAELLDAVGLAARARHLPATLSGGESQRVAIARALANRPRLVLADEPTGNLDDDATARVLGLLRALPAEHGCTVVIVTHNRAVAQSTDRVLALHAPAGADVQAVPAVDAVDAIAPVERVVP